MRHNKRCSRSRGAGGARRKSLCQRQEAIKVHSAAAGSAQIRYSPPSTRGGGLRREEERLPKLPTLCPMHGVTPALLSEGAGPVQGSLAACLARPSRPSSAAFARRWTPAVIARAGVTCPRLPLPGPPGRDAMRSSHRGRGRPWPPPPAILSPRPLPGEGAVGQAWMLSPPGRGARHPPPPAPRSSPRLPTGETHGQ